jgi:REP element-mobilizing transposase RayT
MGYARKLQISLEDTPYYHVISRCVRRAWLWGTDEFAGRDYSHRKHWVLDRLGQLCEIFAIEICAYAVMSNHYHLVLYVDRQKARQWTAEEVIRRWTRLHREPHLISRYQEPDALESERQSAEKIIEQWRERLFDISWFMRLLNEHLARLANAEDDCTGRFWEGRFKSQALLDEAGLLTAMAYVDLNPIRAGIAKTPEESEFASVEQRIRQLKPNSHIRKSTRKRIPLHHFANPGDHQRTGIPYTSTDYLQLVDWTARSIRADKRGSIATSQPSILQRLEISAEGWTEVMSRRGSILGRAMGRLDSLRLHAATLSQRWLKGTRRSQQLYG